jgi:hypothetical protein
LYRVFHDRKILSLFRKPLINRARCNGTQVCLPVEEIDKHEGYRDGSYSYLNRETGMQPLFCPLKKAIQPRGGQETYCQLNEESQPRPATEIIKAGKQS